MANKSRIEQTFDKVAEFPGEKAGFYAKTLGFEPGYQLMRLFAKDRIAHTGIKRNFHYYTVAAAPPDAVRKGDKKISRKKQAGKTPHNGKLSGALVEVPVEHVGSTGPELFMPSTSTDDAAMLGAIIVGVFSALKGRQR